MYDIYIKYFADSSGKLVTTETKLYSVPISNPDNALTDPVIKVEMGKTGSFEFGMAPTHPYYNSMLQMKTMMRVVYDGTTIFRGRVLTIDTSPFTGERKIHLEGDLAFLMDSMQKGVDEDERKELTVLDYLKAVLKQHNDQMMDLDTVVVGKNGDLISLAEAALAGSTGTSGGIDLVPGTGQLDVQESAHVTGDISLADKKIVIGEVPGNYSSAITSAQKVNVSGKKKFGSSSWEKTSSAIESLASDYGGYFRTRYVGSTCYLDWLENSFQYAENSQPIKLAENMIDINTSAEVDNIFTALVPIGSSNGDDLFIDGYKTDIHGNNNRILVPQITKVYSDSELNRGYHAKSDYLNAVNDYGLIYRAQSFPNADTKEKLWSYAVDWIKENYIGGLTSFDITAIDLHHKNGSVPKYLVGDRVKVTYPDVSRHTEGHTPTITKTLTILSIQYNLHNPEKNQYSVGVPSMLVGHEYGTSSKKSSSDSGSGGTGGKKGGGYKGGGDEGKESAEERVRRLELTAYNYIANAKINKDIYNEIYESKLKEYGNTEEGRAKAEKVSGQVLQSSIHVVGRGLNAADPTSPTRSRSQQFVQTMFFDGSNGNMTINSPIIQNPWGLSDEQMKKLNRTNKALTFNAMSQEFGVWKAISTLTPPEEIMKKGPVMVLNAKLGINPTNQKTHGVLNIGGEDTPVDGSKFPGFSANGDGIVKQFQSFFGKGDGTDPEKSPTADINGKNGSAGFGEKGDLGGSKIVINRPLTYKWTDSDGKQHTGTVKAGTIGLDDMHFTKSYDSVKIEVGYAHAMYADYLEAASFKSMYADITEIKANYITADYINAKNVSAALAKADAISVKSLSCTGSMSSSGDLSTYGNLYVGSSKMNVANLTVTNNGENLNIFYVGGKTETFKKGDTDAAYNQGWNDCVDAAVAAGAVYTRTNIYNDSVVGGNAYGHYYEYRGVKTYIGTGWYLTSYAPRQKR